MVWIIVGIVVLILLYLVATYNSLVGLRNKVRNQRSQIDVELKRRFELIPNLVETVKGYAKHEKGTLEEVIKARSAYTSTGNMSDQLKASDQLSGALSKLFALSESYPELKADANFMSLQKDLADIEQKIVYARQFYNDAVMKINNKIEVFPSNIVAGMFNFGREEFFEATKEEQAKVEVKF